MLSGGRGGRGNVRQDEVQTTGTGTRDYSVNTAELLLDASTRSLTNGTDPPPPPKLVSTELLCDRKDHSL